jgi:hypothetical protein
VRRVLLALLVALPAAAAEPELGTCVAVEDLAVKDSPLRGANTVRHEAFGERLRTRRSAQVPANLFELEGGGFVEVALCKPLPLTGGQRFVIDRGTVVYASWGRAKVIRALRTGDAVTVIDGPGPERLSLLLERGEPAGFVEPAALAKEKPTVESFWAHAEARLRVLDERRAQTALESVLDLDPENGKARALLSALLSVREPARSQSLRTGLEPPKPLPSSPLAPPPASGLAWVTGAEVRLRDIPNESFNKKRMTLPIGTPVMVQRLNGKGWALVRATLDRSWSVLATRGPEGTKLSKGEDVPAFFQQEFKPGWMKVEYLTSGEPRLGELEDARQNLAKEGKRDEALAAGIRAHQLAPSRARLRTLVDLALQAGRWQEAGLALAVPATLQRPQGRTLAQLDFSWGCGRGDDPRITEVFDYRAPTPPMACIAIPDPPPCRPCEWAGEGASPLEQAGDALVKWEARRRTLRKKFPDGPYLRVRLDPNAVPAGQTPYIAAIRPSAEDPTVIDLFAVPLVKPKSPGSFLDVWFQVSDEDGLRFDLFFAEEEKSLARTILYKRLQRSAADPLAQFVGVVASLQRPIADCPCGP